MNENKRCVLCGKEIIVYHILPFGFVCSECGKKIIEHLNEVLE